jgi:hypothetical protein
MLPWTPPPPHFHGWIVTLPELIQRKLMAGISGKRYVPWWRPSWISGQHQNNTHLIGDHPWIIHTILQFRWFCGFCRDDSLIIHNFKIKIKKLLLETHQTNMIIATVAPVVAIIATVEIQ